MSNSASPLAEPRPRMGLCNPIEVVVIRSLAVRPRPVPAEEAEPDPIPDTQASDCLSPQHERDEDDLMALLNCGRRRSVLRILASRTCGEQIGGGRKGGTSVGEIARRLGLSQKNLSQHLAPLRTSGLIYATRRGQHREYEITPGRVTCQRDETTGKLKLEVFAAGGSGVSVTMTVGGAVVKDLHG